MRPRGCPAAALAGAAALLIGVLGCSTTGGGSPFRPRKASVTPVLAVADFENKSNVSGHWNLGFGMAEMLTTELMNTRKVTVLERQGLNNILGEIVQQGSEFFRPEGRVARGRLMNAQYLVRGAVTDFTVTEEASSWIRYATFGLFGHGAKARVAIHLRISDVASGEVIASAKTEGESSAGGFGGMGSYKDVAFGGDAFFRTPLGRATEYAVGRAVKEILKSLPKSCWVWQPRVAEASGGEVVINGGLNVGLKPGALFLVREPARSIIDPVTGNVIERLPGRPIGRLRVTEVRAASSSAKLLEGRAVRNDVLEAYAERPP